MRYLKRCVDTVLSEMLGVTGIVQIEGPRACGKTSTALQQAASSLRLDSSPELVRVAEMDPAAIVAGDTPRLIDEWQLAPSLWNYLRHEVDQRQRSGQFILSGSATPNLDVRRHTGAGRVSRLRLGTMSLAEAGLTDPSIDLSKLDSNTKISAKSPLSYRELAEVAVRGGWPGLLDATTRQAILFNRSYCENLYETEIPVATGVTHNIANLRGLVQSISRNISAEATVRSLASDVTGATGAENNINPETISTYLESLEQVYALNPLPAWSVSLRSRSRLRTSPKLHLADPALACAALGIGADHLADSPDFFGQVFESMAIRDLRALASLDFGRVYHYRDNTGLEIDAIIEYPEAGNWAACEVKLGASAVAAAERNLLKLRDQRIDTDRVGRPRFLAVITGTEYAYTLPSGVHVIPLSTLTF